MDPVSIAASACGIAALCGNIISTVGTFIVDIKAIPQTLDDFTKSITTLRNVLNNVDSVVSERPKRLFFAQKQESKHWQDVKNVLDACNACLYRLRNEFPESPTDRHKLLQQARIQLELKLKSNVVLQIRGHISSYTQILQLSLTTMSLGSIWETQQSQDLVRSEIQKLTSEIRAINTIFRQRRIEIETSTCDDLTLAEMLAIRNIEAWRESAESLAAVVTLYEPDQHSIAERAEDMSVWSDTGLIQRDTINSHETTASTNGQEAGMSQPDSGIEIDEAASDWDPEPETSYCLSVDIIQCQIAANQENVARLLEDGLFFQAEQYQRKGIELQDQLWKTHKIPFSDRADTEENLADILRRQGTKDGLRRAKDILQRLLQNEVQGEHESDGDRSQCWRLYHKLSETYLELGFITKAKEFATRALEGRKKLVNHKSAVLETATLLATACQLKQDFDEASGLRTWINKQQALNYITTHSTDSIVPNPALADVLCWCKSRGFDVDSPSFSLAAPNAEGKTPLHIAVSEEALPIVTEIANHIPSLEMRDHDSATALLLACSTRNRKTTEVLLKRGAKLNVVDSALNTPLHRLHSSTGGTAVALLLLKTPQVAVAQALLTAKNVHDKTPLHLACEMANERLLDVLLDNGADINCHGPAGCTPLHVAVYARRVAIVRKLLERGADVGLRDDRGWDALAAAKGARLVSGDIVRLLADHEQHERQRRLSGVSLKRSNLPGGVEGRKASTAGSDKVESLFRKETLVSEASRASGGSADSHGRKDFTSIEGSSRSLKSLKSHFRRLKSSDN